MGRHLCVGKERKPCGTGTVMQSSSDTCGIMYKNVAQVLVFSIRESIDAFNAIGGQKL